MNVIQETAAIEAILAKALIPIQSKLDIILGNMQTLQSEVSSIKDSLVEIIENH